MTNYERICAYINAWHYCVCRKEIGDSEIFVSLTIHREAVTDLDATKVPQSFIDCQSYERIYPISRPIPKYKVGDKVVVLDNIKETKCADKYKVGWVYTITDIGANLSIQINGWYVPPHCVAPYFDDEAEEMTVEQICKALGKNIKIVK